MRKLWALSVICLLLAIPALANPLVPTASSNALFLAQQLVGSPGITITGASLTGGSTQQGTFTGGSGILPFDSGVLLTTGTVANAVGPNDLPNVQYNWNTAGYAPLSALAGKSTYDANILTISFVPDHDVVSFQFVFASDEYDEYVGSNYNDVFGFFLNGVNIALVPGTSTPITVNTVNCFSNDTYYNDNGNGYGGAGDCSGKSVNLQYDGIAGGLYSLPLYAAGSVNAGVENTIVLAIADSTDHIYDSAVFLAGGSFKDENPPVPEPASLVLFGTGLAAVAARLRRK